MSSSVRHLANQSERGRANQKKRRPISLSPLSFSFSFSFSFSYLDAKPLARPRHLARRVDDGLAHGALIEHRELDRDLYTELGFCGGVKKKRRGKEVREDDDGPKAKKRKREKGSDLSRPLLDVSRSRSFFSLFLFHQARARFLDTKHAALSASLSLVDNLVS